MKPPRLDLKITKLLLASLLGCSPLEHNHRVVKKPKLNKGLCVPISVDNPGKSLSC